MAAPSASDMVVVVTGGDPVDPAHLADLPAGARVIAADSGVEHALLLGLSVHHVVGDFDSASAKALATAAAAGASLDRHPAGKDVTDLELALDAALDLGARRIHVLGGHGGRLDHLLANLQLLAHPRYADAVVSAQMGAARVSVVRDAASLRGPIGDLVTLVPLHGSAGGVRTTGLLYPLAGEDLPEGTTRGVSNELIADPATVTLTRGVVVAIQPGQQGTHHQETPR